MELIKASVKGLTVKLWEKLANHNVIGRSVYTITIEDGEGGMYTKGLGDNKEKALIYFLDVIIDIVDE